MGERIQMIVSMMPPRDRQTVLSMADGEPAALSLGDALSLGLWGLTDQEHRVDGFYYTLSALGQEVCAFLQGHESSTSKATGAKRT